MPANRPTRPSLPSPARRAVMARALGLLQLLGVLLILGWVLATDKADVNAVPVLAILALTAATGVALLALRTPPPYVAFPVLAALCVLALGALVALTGKHNSPIALFYPWAAAYGGWFFSRRVVTALTALVSVTYALALAPIDQADLAQWALATGVIVAGTALVRMFKSQLLEGQRHFMVGFERAGIGVALVAPEDGRFLHVNSALAEMLGRPADELEGMSWADITHPDDLEASQAAVDRALSGGEGHRRFEKRYLRPDGETVWALVTTSTVRDRRGRPLHFFGQIVDVSALQVAKQQQTTVAKLGRLALQGDAPSELIENAVEATVRTLGAACGAVWVPAGEDRLLAATATGLWDGVEHVTVPIRPGSQLGFTLRTGNGVRIDDFESDGRFTPDEPLRARGIRSSVTVAVQGPEGRFGVLAVHDARPGRFNDGDASFLQSVAHVLGEALERAHREDAIRHDAVHDELTGLPNRTLLMDRLSQVLAQRRRSGHDAAVLMLDVDNLKLINDSLGHEAGDRVLTTLTPRIEATLRPMDTLACFAGDLFAVVCGDLEDADAAAGVAERLRRAVRRPIDLGEDHVVVGASIGIALASDDRSPVELLRDADAAMHTAKAHGGNRCEMFDPELRSRLISRVRVESELRAALATDELRLHYQPIVSLESGRLTGFEALVRWHHPERGLIMPNDFIPVAEESGLIVPVGRFVLELACRQAETLLPDASVAVNVSARELASEGFAASLADLLRLSGIDPRRLMLEITETTLMDDVEAAVEVLTAVKRLGVGLALDDFGTGYSSLGYLQRFPLDVVKIDRALVSKVTADRDGYAIVHAAVTMAQTLGRRAIAEGVETPAQAKALQELGCELAQGYLYARPMPPDEAAAWRGGAARVSRPAACARA